MAATHKTSLEAQLDRLLNEPVEVARERARTEFDRTIGPHGNRLVLFGAGNMGRRVLAKLRENGIEPLAFSDNQAGKWGKSIDGLLVVPPEEAASRFGRNASFLVTIYNSKYKSQLHSFSETRKQLAGLACDNVVSVVPLRWKYHEAFLPYYHDDLPHKILSDGLAIREAFALWSDNESRQEYVAQIACRLHADFDGLGVPLYDQQYFPRGLFALTAQEFFVDVGAYDGDTLRQFLALRGEDFHHVLALEPDPGSFRLLTAFHSTLPARLQSKIELRPLAAGRQSGHIQFAAGAGVLSSVSALGSMEVECVRLDDLLARSRPTYIKMDIEGAEPDAIQGCQRVLRENRPVLAVCVYHAQDHLWTIPLAIHRMAPDYQFFLRPHMPECWDTVCYAVPPERVRPN
jgi:FkbM family methyltransferase